MHRLSEVFSTISLDLVHVCVWSKRYGDVVPPSMAENLYIYLQFHVLVYIGGLMPKAFSTKEPQGSVRAVTNLQLQNHC